MRCELDYSEGETRIANLSHPGLAWSRGKSRWFCKRATKAANVQSDLGLRCPHTAYGSFSYASHHIITETGHAKKDTDARSHSESPVGWMIHSPANTRRLNHVDSTLNQRQDVESTLNRCFFQCFVPAGLVSALDMQAWYWLVVYMTPEGEARGSKFLSFNKDIFQKAIGVKETGSHIKVVYNFKCIHLPLRLKGFLGSSLFTQEMTHLSCQCSLSPDRGDRVIQACCPCTVVCSFVQFYTANIGDCIC